MATRNETAKRKQALVRWVREAVQSGQLRPGEMIPSVRELGERFGLSLRVVALELATLVGEGLLHSVPRRGTFVGRPARPSGDLFLLTIGISPEAHWQVLRLGFEERIAQLGGATMVLSLAEAVERRRLGTLPTLAGIYDHSEGRPEGTTWGIDRDLPRVVFHQWNEDPLHSDVLAFDDQGGGWQAAQALIARGHRRIAFLAAHPQPNPDRRLLWSEARELGWRSAIAEAGLAGEGLAFHPEFPRESGPVQRLAAAQAMAERLVARPGLTGVVVADGSSAAGLRRALLSGGVAPDRWPEVIGFDDLPSVPDADQTGLRSPWEEIGRMAADCLWDRRVGGYRGQPRVRQGSLRLIHRGGPATAGRPGHERGVP